MALSVKLLCGRFPQKQEDALLPLLVNFSLDCVNRKVLENQMGLKLSGTHQRLVYADVVNPLGDNIYSIKRNMKALIGASKEVGLKVNAEKMKYMMLFCYKNAG
jgi:hypothetical protein